MKKNYFLSLFVLMSIMTQAQWSSDTLKRNCVAIASGYQYEPAICSDGNKGAFVSYTDLNYSPSRIYIQHVDSSGYYLWKKNGISAADTTITGFGPKNTHLVPDNKGGVIVVYSRTIMGGADHIHAQHINASGKLLWNPPVDIDVSADARLLSATSDEHGGAIINWYKYQGGTQCAVQWIDSTGVAYLPTNGLQITDNNKVHYDNRVVYAGSPSLMMAYAVYSDQEILKVQPFDINGLLHFPTPVTLDSSYIRNSGNPGAGYSISAVPNANKAIIVWESQQASHPECVRVQCINADGSLNWNTRGNVIDSASTSHYPVLVCSDGSLGAYLAYNGFNKIYIQHISGEGKPSFQSSIENCTKSGITQSSAELVSDGKGGCIIAWQDGRGSLGVYAQRYNEIGTPNWRNCGAPVFNAYNVGSANGMKLTSSYDGTGIATWLSGIYGTTDVFVGKVDNVSFTEMDEQESQGQSISVYPNPATGLLNVYVNENADIGLYQVIDISGKVIIPNNSYTGRQFTVPTQDLHSGVYILQTLNKGNKKRCLFVIK